MDCGLDFTGFGFADHVGPVTSSPEQFVDSPTHELTSFTSLSDEISDEVEGVELTASMFCAPERIHGGKGRVNNPKGRPKGSMGRNSGGLKNWKLLIADYVIMNPGSKRKELAGVFGVTPEWLSRVMNSDAYVKFFEMRLKAHQGVVSEQVVAVAGEVALTGLKKLKLRMVGDEIDTRDLTQATKLAGDMLGIGKAAAAGAGVAAVSQHNYFGVNADLLATARTKMEAVAGVEDAEVLEGDFLDSIYDEERPRLEAPK